MKFKFYAIFVALPGVALTSNKECFACATMNQMLLLIKFKFKLLYMFDYDVRVIFICSVLAIRKGRITA